MSKCVVCNKETSDGCVCCSSTGAFSNFYCSSCLNKGLESYTDLVSMEIYYEELDPIYRKEIVDPSLAFANKTPEDFNNDIKLNMAFI